MKNKQKIRKITIAGISMFAGIIIFKYLLMSIYGNNILYDASQHVVMSFFVLYIFWFFIKQNKNWRIPYFIFSASIITIISLQRIIEKQHNEYGIIMGILISIISIGFAEKENIRF